MMKLSLIGVATGCLVVSVGVAAMLRLEESTPMRAKLEKQIEAGNFKDALDGYRQLLLDPKDDPMQVGTDLRRALDCLERLNRIEETDSLRDQAIALHRGNWRLLEAAALSLLSTDFHHGFLIAGEFKRGEHRGGGRMVGSFERDRARAIQLLVEGLPRATADADRAAAGTYLLRLSQALMANRQTDSWKLQSLTPLDSLPDYEDSPWPWGGMGEGPGAPVDAEGNPVYYPVPKSFEAARNDGERWRWSLTQAAELHAKLLDQTRLALAEFCDSQFGTQTLSRGGPSPRAEGENDPYQLATLRDDETVARLATGIKRFTLPDEFNFLRLYQAVAEGPNSPEGELAIERLTDAFMSRRQFDRAAATLQLGQKKYGDGDQHRQRQLDQILKAWGEFQPLTTQPAGRGAGIDYVYRNGRRVRFDARPIHIDRLIADIKAYLAANPGRIDWQNINIDQIGYRLVNGDGARYAGPVAASWTLDLRPLPGHFDQRITVTTPLQTAGAYLVTATMEGGNVSRIVLWIDDTVLLKKPLDGATYYFVADSRTGQPVPGANVELFGWRQRQVGNANRFVVETKSQSMLADSEGQLIVPANADANSYQWLITARTSNGRRAHLGFTNVWFGARHDPVYNAVRVYNITDRPVYRPGSTVKFKFWVARSRYDEPERSEFAQKRFAVEIRNPKGDKVYAETFRADEYGGFDGSFELPSDATLGVYQVFIPNRGGGTFRVEEYKKPEFEVAVDAPDTPVMLGETIEARIKADYYFGGPVTQAKVKYKITRTTASDRWYPQARWDWLYGSGYWWFAPEAAWFPGWSSWGIRGPLPWWWNGAPAPPEIVAEAEVPIGADGTIPVRIDTALARATHPDQDHRYEITAEVTDQSRRTITGSGTVLVARKPFSVYLWLDRGHYRVGDAIHANVMAQTLDHRPVAGEGTLKLLKISYDAQRRPVETEVQSWGLTTRADGRAEQTIKAAAPGQYRLAATIDDGQGHTIEGGYLVTVTGEGFDGSGFRYNDLEIIPDQKDYRPGDRLRLMINTNQPGATVLLFPRPTNGVYLRPKVVHLRGKSTIEEIEIAQRDMPNIFVEAVTIAGGRVHVEARNIAVPPESRVADVAVEPAQPTYKPGQKAKVHLKLTGPDGKPFVGSTVVSVYDKAVEYISGGSNVPEIKAFFWKWVRSHHPQTQSSLDRSSQNILKPNEVGMQDLDQFGLRFQGWGWGRMGGGGMGGMGGMAPARASRTGAPTMMMAAPAPAAAPGSTMMAEGLAAAFAPAEAPAGEDAAPPVGPAPPVVRTNFADTAFWSAAITTGKDGTAEVEFTLPESLTTWKVKSWTLGPGTRVGQSEAEIITTKDVLVRLQAPRFFVEKDEVVLSANVHNKLKNPKSIQVQLEFDGSVLEPLDETSRTVEVAAGGETRVDWRVKVAHEGEAVIRMKALTDEDSDAVQMTFPAYVHGMLKQEAFAGSLRPNVEKADVRLQVPEERRPDQTRLEVHFSPTLAGALVDALPYLADYPYGCTEQTLNRFLPTVITQRLLIQMGLDLRAIRDKRTNLNAQELGEARERAKGWKRFEHNPVFDEAEVARMARAGIDRLAEMQLSDGGWGWFSGFGEYPSAHTTALVVHGLQLARQNDLALPDGLLKRGIAWLTRYQADEVRKLQNAATKTRPYKDHAGDLDALVFMVLTDAAVKDDAMLGFLDRDRPRLSVYAKALFGLALEKLSEKDKLAEVLRNIRQYLVEDAENQTAYLNLPNQSFWWFWYGSEIETHAFYLKLLARTDPKGDLAPRLVKYLLNNRKHATYWESTRDTAFCIEAMADFLRRSGEDRPDMTVHLAVDGTERKQVRITPADLFAFDNTLVIEGPALSSGEHTVTVSRTGTGPVYFNAYLTNFTLEDPITKTGLEIKVERQAYRLVREDKTAEVAGSRGQVVGQKVEKYRREPLSDEATLRSGELVEVELTIESKNDYEYLVFEDFKAAGFEPVEVRSGYNGNDLGAYVEFRDERVAFFVRALARGKHSVAYRLRAEIPGRFHALPARGHAMYAPELKANSDEVRLKIED